MRNGIAVALIAAITVLAAHSDPARAAAGACTVKEAQRDVVAARRSLKRAEARLREARRVLAQTKRESALHGAPVGRWVRLARRTGWHWDEIGTLMRVMYGESRGDPRATNGQYRGLMQLGAHWYACYWQFDPYQPRASLLYACKLKRLCGWEQWSAY